MKASRAIPRRLLLVYYSGQCPEEPNDVITGEIDCVTVILLYSTLCAEPSDWCSCNLAKLAILCRQTRGRQHGPILASDALSDIEQLRRVVLLLDRQQSFVIRAKERVLPVWF